MHNLPEIPEIPKLSIAEQKCAVVRIYERMQRYMPVWTARGIMTEEEAKQCLGELLCVAKTLDDADQFIDIRERIDPRAHAKAMQELEEGLQQLKPKVSKPPVTKKKAPEQAFIPKPFDSGE